MRVAVFGTGGVGGYFGGRLAQAGEDVIFIARGAHLQAIRSEGLRVESIKGDFLIKPAFATDDPRRVGEVDAILVAVKAWQVPEAAVTMQPMVGESTFVVPLGNGVDAPVQLSSALGASHVLGGLCRISALIAAPGTIRHVGMEPFVAFGEMDGHRSQRADQLRQAFLRANVSVEIPEDIQVAMWEKFVFIAAISGVGAVTRSPIGIVRSLPETRQMLEEAVGEVVAVARGRRVRLPEDIATKTMTFIDGLPAGATASMQRDILEGKPSELGSQNGAMMRMGLEMGIPTPTHAFIYHSLLPQELRARGEVTF